MTERLTNKHRAWKERLSGIYSIYGLFTLVTDFLSFIFLISSLSGFTKSLSHILCILWVLMVQLSFVLIPFVLIPFSVVSSSCCLVFSSVFVLLPVLLPCFLLMILFSLGFYFCSFPFSLSPSTYCPVFSSPIVFIPSLMSVLVLHFFFSLPCNLSCYCCLSCCGICSSCFLFLSSCVLSFRLVCGVLFWVFLVGSSLFVSRFSLVIVISLSRFTSSVIMLALLFPLTQRF